MYQHVSIIGFLGQDPETRYTTTGTAVTNFSVATSERWRDKNTGDQQERTTWFRCEAWGKTAELVGEYLRKGSQVHCEGKMHEDHWEKDGQKRVTWKLRVNRVHFLGRSGSGSDEPRQSESRRETAPAQEEDFDDQIPF